MAYNPLCHVHCDSAGHACAHAHAICMRVPRKHAGEVTHHDGAPGKSAVLEVEAYVVDVEGAACADDAGLLNPLLHCFQRNIFNVNVWALPAVEVQAISSLMALSLCEVQQDEDDSVDIHVRKIRLRNRCCMCVRQTVLPAG